MRALAALAIAAAVLLPGCLDGTREADLLVLEYTLVAETGSPGSADPGPHCASAGLKASGKAWMEGRLGGGEGVIVQPRLEGGWSTSGAEGYAKRLPAGIYTDIHHANDAAPWVTIDGDYEDGRWTVTVNGDAVSLPHEWTYQATGWHINATLREGPHSYESIRPQTCE